ncbi:MAG TPA: 30S ribosomal protein S16 [Candidatus Saccharimonadales bacterium]|nr:30S ribosomal protein S16 [Candidatus Saccharimonadales bacterium]
MLAIRLQRTGRSGHAQFRMIVQDSRRTPTSGKVVAFLGSYDPHSKVGNIDKEKAEFYLKNGAQPSTRTAVLLKNEGVKLPKWVVIPEPKKRSIKNVDKLRKNRPAEAVVAEKPEPKTEETNEEVAEVSEAPKEESSEATSEVEESTEEAENKVDEPSEPEKAEEKVEESAEAEAGETTEDPAEEAKPAESAEK